MEFYQAYWARLVATLSWALPIGEDPEDTAQEAFARAYQHWSTVRTYERPDAWLFVTAYRLATSARKRMATRLRYRPQESTPNPDPLERSFLGRALAQIPPRQRAALLLRHYYGLSTRETAQAMRCPEGTVKSLLQRGLAAVRDVIGPEAGEA